ncbi:Serine/threonine protein phosphatase, related [Neospora caninum Liverpool]|uniref:Serine/threonine protein phosphatase, related n=1 Tax=Neospora caninum (strain Liverpool) TaxID=572307 RepID=F0VKB2_NEOCL|nr:Serine/threonine protein phosphatase, related [Neospora caninum Liverpool]CBZ54513.1 Serine/threonine protein phosphatase, related [Neospora caninum Liverpool]|eukprot:XP_003884543.1 Serine/threonine protein phosphatase, related [Neospora caninum Liverpool]
MCVHTLSLPRGALKKNLGVSAEAIPQESLGAAPPGQAAFASHTRGSEHGASSPVQRVPSRRPPSFSPPSPASAVSQEPRLSESSAVSADSVPSSLPSRSSSTLSPAPSSSGVWASLQSSHRIPVQMVGARAAVKSISVGNQTLLLALDTQTEGVRLFLSNSTACTQPPSLPRSASSSPLGAKASDRKLLSESTKRVESSAAAPAGRARERDGEAAAHATRGPEGDFVKILFKTLPFLRSRGKTRNSRVKGGQKRECYDPRRSGLAAWCLNRRQACNFLSDAPFQCRAETDADVAQAAPFSQHSDGVRVAELRLEGLDLLRLDLATPADSPAPPAFGESAAEPEGRKPPQVPSGAERRVEAASEQSRAPIHEASIFPVKLVADRKSAFYDPYPGLDGVWGIAGPEFCCRNASLWSSTLHALNVTSYAFDLNFPASNTTFSSSAAQAVPRRGGERGGMSWGSSPARSAPPASVPLSFLHLGVLEEDRTEVGGSAPGADAGGKLKGFATYDEAGRWTGPAWTAEERGEAKTDGENETEKTESAGEREGREEGLRGVAGQGETFERKREAPEQRDEKGGEASGNKKLDKRIGGEDIIWGQRIQTGNVWADSVAHFVSYDWQLCGHSLMDNSHMKDWMVTVDLSSECLVVPRPLWLSMRAWMRPALNETSPLCTLDDDFSSFVPAHALAASVAAEGSVFRRMCPLRGGRAHPKESREAAARPPLPVLSFSLRDTTGVVFDRGDSPQVQTETPAPRVELPLEQLAVSSPEAGPGEALCVVPQPHSLLSREGRTVRLGTRAVAAFHFIVDQKGWRVGLLPKTLPLPSSNEACAAQAACRGEQTYVSSTNECVDPLCSERLLFSLNDETKICELSPTVVPAAVTVVLLLLGLETAVVCFQWANVLKARTLT